MEKVKNTRFRSKPEKVFRVCVVYEGVSDILFVFDVNISYKILVLVLHDRKRANNATNDNKIQGIM